MSTRRSRISARPNVARVKRGDAPSSGVVGDGKVAPPNGPVVGDKPNEVTEDKDGPAVVTSVESSLVLDKRLRLQDSPEVEAVEADNIPSTDTSSQSSVKAVIDSSTADKDASTEKSKPTNERAATRRSRIQAKPSVSRKPRQSVRSAAIPAADTTDGVTESASEKITSPSSGSSSPNADSRVGFTTDSGSAPVAGQETATAGNVSGRTPEVPSPTFSKPLPALPMDTAAPSTQSDVAQGTTGAEAEPGKPRPYKPRTKPNVLEAGRARMRRLSESLDLSPHLPSPSRRHRHSSTPGGAERSESVVQVEPIKSSTMKAVTFPPDEAVSTASPSFQNAQDQAKKRNAGEAEIDREIIEQEHMEILAEGGDVPVAPKPKRSRKVRRMVKSDQAPDTSKMTMKDLIYYQPTSNPLPQREEKKNAESRRKSTNSTNQDSPPANPADTSTNQPTEEVEEAPLAPQVMIGEDGKVIINQQSLTVQTESSKRTINYEDVTVGKDDEGATYASFRASRNTKFWTAFETAQFYKALNCVGTDFSLMCQLFPKRSRTELKNKFKKEERTSLEKVQLAMQGKLNFEAEPFPEFDKEKEKQEKQAQKEASKMEKKKKRFGNTDLRTFYEVEDSNEFRAGMSQKRRLGADKIPLRLKNAMTNDEDSYRVEWSANLPQPKGKDGTKKMLTLRTGVHLVTPSSSDLSMNQPQYPHLLSNQRQLPHSSIANQMPPPPPLAISAQSAPVALSLSSQSTPVLLPSNSGPVRPTAVRAIPSISTMLNQNPETNQKITNLVKCAARMPASPSPHPEDNQDMVLSPLYTLENGDTLLIRSLTIPGSVRKMHHLYLYTPPRQDGSGASNAPVIQRLQTPVISSPPSVTASSSETSNISLAPASSSQALDLSKSSPLLSANQSPELTKLITPSHSRTRISCYDDLPSQSVVEAIPKSSLVGVDEHHVGCQEKILNFPDL